MRIDIVCSRVSDIADPLSHPEKPLESDVHILCIWRFNQSLISLTKSKYLTLYFSTDNVNIIQISPWYSPSTDSFCISQVFWGCKNLYYLQRISKIHHLKNITDIGYISRSPHTFDHLNIHETSLILWYLISVLSIVPPKKRPKLYFWVLALLINQIVILLVWGIIDKTPMS